MWGCSAAGSHVAELARPALLQQLPIPPRPSRRQPDSHPLGQLRSFKRRRSVACVLYHIITSLFPGENARRAPSWGVNQEAQREVSLFQALGHHAMWDGVAVDRASEPVLTGNGRDPDEISTTTVRQLWVSPRTQHSGFGWSWLLNGSQHGCKESRPVFQQPDPLRVFVGLEQLV
jgi:hypothetical protein